MDKEMKQAFWQNEVPAQTRQYINLAGGAACVTGAMTAIMALLLNPLAWLDAILSLGLAFGILSKKSRACALVMLVYYIISKLIQLFSMGMGIGAMVTAICFSALYALGVVGTYRYQNQLRAYEQTLVANSQPNNEAAWNEQKAEADNDSAFYD